MFSLFRGSKQEDPAAAQPQPADSDTSVTSTSVITPQDTEGGLYYSTDVPVQDHAFEMLKSGDYLDGVTLIAFLEDSSFLIAQVIISNIGLYTNEPGVAVKYWDATGKRTYFGMKYSKSDIVLADDNTSIKFKDVDLKFDHAKKSYHLRLGGMENNVIHCDLVWENELDPSSGTGGLRFGREERPLVYIGDKQHYFFQVHCLVRAKVSGSLSVEGKSVASTGIGLVQRSTQNIKPHKMANHWTLLKLATPEATLQLNTFHTPGSSHEPSVQVSQGWLVYKNRLLAVTSNNITTVLAKEHDPETGYSPPTQLIHTWKGVTVGDAKPFEASVEISPKKLYDKFDVLAALPWILRVIIKTFIAKPYYYQWFDDVTVKVTIGDPAGECEKFELQGKAFHEFIYVNPEK